MPVFDRSISSTDQAISCWFRPGVVSGTTRIAYALYGFKEEDDRVTHRIDLNATGLGYRPGPRELALEAALLEYVAKYGMTDIARAAIMFRPEPDAIVVEAAGDPAGLKIAH